MKEKIITNLKKRKVKVFLMFLLFSSLAWFISNLSETYTSNVIFDLKYTNTPENFILMNASKQKVDVKLEAIGFQFLAFNFITKSININLSSVKKNANIFFIPHRVYKKQIEKQLSNSMKLLDIDTDTIFFDFQEVVSKEIPVQSRIKVNLVQNYLLDGDLDIDPKVIEVKGPKNQIDSIRIVKTVPLNLDGISSDFSQKIALYKSESLLNTTFSQANVIVSGKVSKFSERIIKVPVQVINLPEGVNIKTFPAEVSILCKAKINILKNLESSSFQITVDYNSIDKDTKKLELKLSKKPKKINSITIEEKEVTYILKRE